MAQKRILLIGERSLSYEGYAYADSFYDILTGQGHVVKSIDPAQTPWWMRGERSFLLSGLEQKLFSLWFNRMVIEVAHDFKPDVCFVIKGHVLHPQTLAELKENLDLKLVLLYPDNPFMFSNGNSNAHVVRGLPLYDVVLSWAQMMQPVFTSLGVAHTCYFPFGYDERFFTYSCSENQAFDLGFVGTADDERAVLLENVIRKAPDITLGIWGNRWSEYFSSKPLLKKCYQGEARYKHAMVCMMQQSKITLNPVRLQNHTAHNMRSLEAAAAGVFQLATRTHEHAHVLFEEGVSIALYASVDELVEKVYWYRDRAEERNNIAQHAQKAVLRYRLQQMLPVFFNNNCCFC